MHLDAEMMLFMIPPVIPVGRFKRRAPNPLKVCTLCPKSISNSSIAFAPECARATDMANRAIACT